MTEFAAALILRDKDQRPTLYFFETKCEEGRSALGLAEQLLRNRGFRPISLFQWKKRGYTAYLIIGDFIRVEAWVTDDGQQIVHDGCIKGEG